MIKKDCLINMESRATPPHVVTLGAGASLAAFPNGDHHGQRLPLMNNIIRILGIQDQVSDIYPDLHNNFESFYSRLYSDNPNSDLVHRIEKQIENFFIKLELPSPPTLYDYLLLSLREKDAIFTFNWDPFLYDAYKRTKQIASVPNIYHLHGNVRIGGCSVCEISGERGHDCHLCSKELTPTRLLFPIDQKDYNQDPFIKRQWTILKEKLQEAWYVTIFGYSAPNTDKEAMELFKNGWIGDGPEKPIERLEVIDIRDKDELRDQWGKFSHFGHFDVENNLFNSALGAYPRRTCEALGYKSIQGEFVESFPLKQGTWDSLGSIIAEMTSFE